MIRNAVLPWPHPLLAEPSHRIVVWNEHLKTLCQDLRDTVEALDQAMGEDGMISMMSAVQIGSPTMVFYIGKRLMRGEAKVFINPIQLSHGDMMQVMAERCLSVPEIEIKVQRWASVRVEARDERGDVFTVNAGGALAQAIQHEMNHLKGKCLPECCNKVKRRFLRDRQRKFNGHRGMLLQYDLKPIEVSVH